MFGVRPTRLLLPWIARCRRQNEHTATPASSAPQKDGSSRLAVATSAMGQRLTIYA